MSEFIIQFFEKMEREINLGLLCERVDSFFLKQKNILRRDIKNVSSEILDNHQNVIYKNSYMVIAKYIECKHCSDIFEK